jgi:hypothetical protein
MTNEHFNQKPRRRAEFIKPPNILKTKVGSGGLSDDILNKAQALIENTAVDFQPLAEMYLEAVGNGIERARKKTDRDNPEELIAGMLYPAMQLKANGGMFHYPLVTRIGDLLVQFLEVIEEPDNDAVEIVMGFHTTIRAVVAGRVKGDGGRYGAELIKALDDACYRYFDKYPDNIDITRKDKIEK